MRVVRRVALLTILVMSLASCGGESTTTATPSPTPSFSPTASPEATSSPSMTDADDDPMHFFTDPVPDGRYPTWLLDVDADGRTIGFDIVQWISGDEARTLWDREMVLDPGGPPNDYLILNLEALAHRQPVADDVDVQLVRLGEDSDADLDPATFEELPGYLADNTHEMDEHLGGGPYWLTVADGVVTAIEEQYRP